MTRLRDSLRMGAALAGDFAVTGTADGWEVDGPHRFLEIGGVTGYQPTSRRTRCRLATDLHARNEGSMALWVCPLETLAPAAPMHGFMSRDPLAQEYGLVADSFPNNDPDAAVFAWYWRSVWHPQMIAKFKHGAAAGGHADYAVTPYVPVEHLPLRERQWYEFFLTWNKKLSRLYLYANGVLCGTTSFPFRADAPRLELFLGNTAMVMANFRVYDAELDRDEVAAAWKQAPFSVDPARSEEIAVLHDMGPKRRVDWEPSGDWALVTDNPLRAAGSFAGWTQQGCLEPGFALKELTHDGAGLLLETPERIDNESRVYFWSPDTYEGDVAIQFDFMPERPTGLALLVVQATGMQREDFLTDHPPRTTGSMNTIINDRVRSYHWEFFRHSVDVRGDLDTQVLIKNPWLRPLGLSTRALPQPGRWCRLLFVQEDSRLRAGIDGEWLLDVTDDPLINNGPVLNAGRIGLRLMYQTRMRFRDLRVWNRAR